LETSPPPPPIRIFRYLSATLFLFKPYVSKSKSIIDGPYPLHPIPPATRHSGVDYCASGSTLLALIVNFLGMFSPDRPRTGQPTGQRAHNRPCRPLITSPLNTHQTITGNRNKNRIILSGQCLTPRPAAGHMQAARQE
jgi:hypothetical protein